MSPRERRYALSALVQLVVAPLLIHDWDGFVFIRTVHDFLAGKTPYAVVEANPTYIHLGHAWPPLNTWYAYPPLPLLLMTPTLAVAFGSASAPWMLRVALKVPLIGGTLALAYVGEMLVRSKSGEAAASDWERMILFNPFVLFVSAAWGMFDAWMLALLLLCVLLLERRRVPLAGAAFGAASLVKLFPLFAAPAFMLHVASRFGRRRAAQFVAAAVATFVVVSLPFAIGHPRGFFLQVIGMHLQRPPQGLSLLGVADGAAHFAIAKGWMHKAPSLDALSRLTFGLTLGVTILTTTAVARARSSTAFVQRLVGLFLGVLFTSKVLNEQYFLIPVVLCAFVWCTSRVRWSLFAYRAFSAGALVAALVLGWHVLTFWPAGVADALFGMRSYVMAGRLNELLHLSPAAFTFLPVAAAVAALAPASYVGVRRIVRDGRAGARILAVFARGAVPRVRLPRAAVVGLLALGPAGLQAATFHGSPRAELRPLDSSNRHVGAFYYLWWANPSHDPAVRDGNWTGVSERPLDGYYTVSSAKLQKDFRAARRAGVDLMITSFHEYDLPLLPAALHAAYEQNVVVAPLVELGELFRRPEVSTGDGFALTPESENAVVELTSKALAVFASSPAAYRPDGKLAVFLFDSYFAEGKLRPAVSKALLDRVLALAKGESQAELLASAPQTFAEMLGAGPHLELWRRAYAAMYRDFWRHVRAALEKRFGPLLLLSGESWNSGAPLHRGAEFAIEGLNVFDGSFIYSPSFVWVLHKRSTYEHNWKRWVVRNVLQAQYERGAGHRVIATVNPAYDDRALRKKKGFRIDARGPRGDTYDLTWKLALDLSPDLVLISTWNEFFEGSAIEPTHEHGDAFLARTHEWSKRLRAPRARTKRGLVVTGEASAHFTAGLADPSVEGRYAHDLQVLVERDLGGISWEAVDVESAAQKDFARYDLILVEPGLEVGTRATDLASRLEHWAEAGGRLLMSGASAGSVWQRLVHASGNGDLQAVVRAGAIALPPGARPRAWQLEGDVEPFLSYDGDHKPAAWLRHVGSGEIVGTSFNVAGREHYPGSDASLAFCGSIAPLLSSGLACKNADPAVVP